MTDSQVGTKDAALQHEWYRAVAKVFARTRKQDPSDIPDDVWKKLIKPTYDGIDVKPLYMRTDQGPEPSAPGEFPYTRGAKLLEADNAGWGIREVFGPAVEVNATAGGQSAKDINKRILHALNVGTTVLELKGIQLTDIPGVLNDVYLDLAPIALATPSKELGDAFLDFLETNGDDKTTADLGASPLTSGFDSSQSVDLDTAIAWAKKASGLPGAVHAITVNGVSLSNQGATDSQEIGLVLAATLEYLRKLTDAGLSVEDAVDQISIRLAATDDFFSTICKFRALRSLLARMWEVLGIVDHPLPAIHAETAPVMFAQRDPYTNILQCTIASFAAGVGGATSVLVHPFDYAIKNGLPGARRSFAHRIARNINLLLLEESHLGFVADPAGGSYYAEFFTDQLEEKAWGVLTDVESKDGFITETDNGDIQKLLDESYEKRRDDIAHRRTKVTAINEFPNLAEKPLAADLRIEPTGVRRWGADFEALRNRSDAFFEKEEKRPVIKLAPLGPLAKHNIRTGFTTNLLASGGIQADNPGQVTPDDENFATQFKDAPVVVVCGTNAEYAENAGSAIDALRAAGVKKVLLAGAPKAVENLDDSSKPDDYLNMKIDAVSTLSGLLDELGA